MRNLRALVLAVLAVLGAATYWPSTAAANSCPARSADDGVFGCFVTPSFISKADLQTLTQKLGTDPAPSDAQAADDLYAVYTSGNGGAGYVRATAHMLRGRAFRGVNADGLALAFATTAAFELKRVVAPDSGSLDYHSVLANTLEFEADPTGHPYEGILCEGLASLADQLFFLLDSRVNAKSRAHVEVIGIASDNPGIATRDPSNPRRSPALGQHVMLSSTGTGVPLVTDPTTSIVAGAGRRGGLYGLALRVPMSIVQFPYRERASTRGPTTTYPDLLAPGFRAATQMMVAQATFEYRALMYVIDNDGANWHAGNAPYQPSTEFLAGTFAARIGGRPGFWALTVGGDGAGMGTLSEITSRGVRSVSSGLKTMVAVDGGVYAVGTGGSLLEWRRAATPELPASLTAGGGPLAGQTITQIAAGPDGKSVYTLSSTGAVTALRPTSSDRHVRQVLSGGAAALVGTGRETYVLMDRRRGGVLWRITSSGRTSEPRRYVWIAAGYGSRHDLGPAGSNVDCPSAASCPGEIYGVTTAGELRYRAGAAKSWVDIASGVTQAPTVAPMRGISVNVLESGRVRRFTSYAIPLRMAPPLHSPLLPFGRFPTITGVAWPSDGTSAEPGQGWTFNGTAVSGVPAGTTVQSIAVDPDGFGLDVFPAGGSTPYLSYSSGTF